MCLIDDINEHVGDLGYFGHARRSLGFAHIYTVGALKAIAHAALPTVYPDTSTVETPARAREWAALGMPVAAAANTDTGGADTTPLPPPTGGH